MELTDTFIAHVNKHDGRIHGTDSMGFVDIEFPNIKVAQVYVDTLNAPESVYIMTDLKREMAFCTPVVISFKPMEKDILFKD